MSFWLQILNLYNKCNSNIEFIHEFEKLNELIYKKKHIIKENNLCNNELYIDNIENLIEKYNNKKLITTRLGVVESKFIIRYFLNKKIYDHDTISDELDLNMKTNAGFYYKNNELKKEVCDWWCTNTIEIINNSVITSCFTALYSDLYLWSLLNKKGPYYNWGLIHKLILKNSENFKILYIGNATSSIKYAYENNLQNKWKFKISNFTMDYYKTPQTTINMPYPDNSIKETTEKIVDDIINKHFDFDTAILGCGAYGPPIINLLSKKFNNKNIIYLGSDCYKMFGLYTRGMPIPKDEEINASNWIEIQELCDPRCKHIDQGKYWK